MHFNFMFSVYLPLLISRKYYNKVKNKSIVSSVPQLFSAPSIIPTHLQTERESPAFCRCYDS